MHAGAGAGKCGVLWFLHISKTGGSSYHAYLEKKLERRELDALWEFWSKGEKPYRPISFETNLKPKLDQLAAIDRVKFGDQQNVYLFHGQKRAYRSTSACSSVKLL